MKNDIAGGRTAGVRYIARHFALAPELDDMTRAAEFVEHLAVPDRDQDVAAGSNPGTDLGVLTIALVTVVANRFFRAPRGKRDYSVRALGERRHDLQRTVGETLCQVVQQLTHGGLDTREFLGDKVAVTRDANDERLHGYPDIGYVFRRGNHAGKDTA